MAKMFTRTVTTWKATAYSIDEETLKVKAIGAVEYQAASTGKTEARAALIAAGYDVPRGTTVKIEKVSEETYGMSVDEFMLHAHRIEKVDAE